MADLNDNFPLPFEKSTMWNNANIRWIYHGKTDVSPENLAVSMASGGYYRYEYNLNLKDIFYIFIFVIHV